MKVIDFNLNNPKLNNKQSIVTIGKFFSFHKGHLKIIEKINKKSDDLNKIAIIFSQTKENIYTLEKRLDILRNNGFDYVYIFKPTTENFNISSIDFINYLKETLKANKIVIGKDFKFGKQRTGNIKTLKENFKTYVVKIKKFNNKKLSTKLIKETIQTDIENFPNLTNLN